MNDAPATPTGTLEFGSTPKLSRLTRAGGALRLAPSIYVVGASLPPEQVTRHHLYAIIGHVWPGAVLHGSTALAGGQPSDGAVHIAHPDPPRKSALRLPGVVVHPEVAPGALPGDMPLPHGVFLAGQARTLVSNVPRQGRPPRSCAGTEATEDKVDELVRRGGTGRIRQVLGELDVIAGSFDPYQVEKVRQMLAAVLGTVTGRVSSQRLQARLAGTPYDTHRLERLDAVLSELQTRPPVPRPVSGPNDRFAWEPFFEAYFSNFIEGTEFGVEQARRIAVEGEIPAERPADAHDVAATYRLVIDQEDRARVAGSADEFVELLRDRHAVLMAARPDKHPGQFKQRPNYAGGYRFVDPEMVEGTLRRGFDRMVEVIDPMARAVAMMVLITECHPFDDGNGRVARLMSNSELSHAGQIRVIIPTSFRNNYLAALSAISTGHGDGQSLHAVLDFGQRWVSRVDWSSFETSHQVLEQTNAYREPGEAEMSGNRLRLPE